MMLWDAVVDCAGVDATGCRIVQVDATGCFGMQDCASGKLMLKYRRKGTAGLKSVHCKGRSF